MIAAALAFAQAPDQNSSEVTGPENLIFSVADLDRSVAFYRDAFALELKSRPGAAPGLPAPVALNEAFSNLTDTQGAKFRAVRFELPGALFGLELAEFTGIERKPAEARVYDPGAAILALTVWDIDAALATALKTGARVVTVGGEPVHLATRAGSGRRFIFLRDPDGFLLELSQPDTPPSRGTGPAGRIIACEFATAAGDTETTLAFYNRVFGFEIRPGASFTSNPVVRSGLGALGSQIRMSHAILPGEKAEVWGILELKDIERKLFSPRLSDPGASAFSLRVRNADALAAKVQAEGGVVVSRGGAIGSKPGGIFVRDPNGLLLELVQRRAN